MVGRGFLPQTVLSFGEVPERTPARHSVDGPLLGNGDMKVALGGIVKLQGEVRVPQRAFQMAGDPRPGVELGHDGLARTTENLIVEQ